jgi:hypothetical protein
MPVLVDTNVLLDVVTGDPSWGPPSLATIQDLAVADELFVNPVVYAELSIGFERIEEIDQFLDAIPAAIRAIPRPALFLAGKVFQRYRRRGGSKTGVLPDFFIGAHASVERMTLLTRDRGRYRHYFPALDLISPES